MQKLKKSIDLIKRALRRYGLFGSMGRIFVKTYNRIFMNRHVVFEHSGGAPALALPDGIRLERHDGQSEIPSCFLEQLEREEGTEPTRSMLGHFMKGAVLWLILQENDVAGYWWTIRGGDDKEWYVDLSPDDLVLFNAYTFFAWRGKGLSPAAAETIVQRELAGKGRAYMDIAVWNKASLHAVSKTGFKAIAQMKPLKE